MLAVGLLSVVLPELLTEVSGNQTRCPGEDHSGSIALTSPVFLTNGVDIYGWFVQLGNVQSLFSS